ncbi:AtpZ/AtpI family protein [Bartonella sp. B30(2025)]
MAKGDEPIMPKKGAEEKRHGEYVDLEDLECRSRNLDLALIRKKALKKRASYNQGGEPQGKMAYAVELSSEFLASVIVGVVLGLGFDKLVDSTPWGLVFFLFFGFTAGIWNILRSVGYMSFRQLGKNSKSSQDKRVDQRPNE